MDGALVVPVLTLRRLIMVGVIVLVMVLGAAVYVSPSPRVRAEKITVPKVIGPPTAVRKATVPSTTTVVAPSAPTTIATAPTTIATQPQPVATPQSMPPQSSYGCGPALTYLAAHAAPGFNFECPGYALGHQGLTCIDIANVCPDEALIVISDPCAAAYMNEASNSWVGEGLSTAPFDPFGNCPTVGISVSAPSQLAIPPDDGLGLDQETAMEPSQNTSQSSAQSVRYGTRQPDLGHGHARRRRKGHPSLVSRRVVRAAPKQ
jgi:hypothetical protein